MTVSPTLKYWLPIFRSPLDLAGVSPDLLLLLLSEPALLLLCLSLLLPEFDLEDWLPED